MDLGIFEYMQKYDYENFFSARIMPQASRQLLSLPR